MWWRASAGTSWGLPGVAEVPLAVPNRNADTALVQVIPRRDPTTRRPPVSWRTCVPSPPSGSGRYGVEHRHHRLHRRLDRHLRPPAAAPPVRRVRGRADPGAPAARVPLDPRVRQDRGQLPPQRGRRLRGHGARLQPGLVHGGGEPARDGPGDLLPPIILMGILFGLSMDYEMFLSSRMREEWVHGEPHHLDRGGLRPLRQAWRWPPPSS